MPTKSDDLLIACRELCVGYGGHALLPPIEMEVRRGEFWAIVGKNGSGKTTWLRTLLGLIPPVAGRVVHERAELRLAYLPQRHDFDELYPVTVFDVVHMGLLRHGSPWFRHVASSHERVERALAQLEVQQLGPRPFRQLSDGQKQRVLFARLLVSDPDVAVLDEPSSAMDASAEREAAALLDRLRVETGLALLVVSHDAGLFGEAPTHALWFDRDRSLVRVAEPRSVLASEPPRPHKQPFGAESTEDHA